MLVMTRLYRETSHQFNHPILGSIGNNVFKIEPLDANQVPGGYLKTYKLSISADNSTDEETCFLIVASADPNPLDHDAWITGAACRGAGTVWLNVRQKIRQASADDERNDAMVYIHVYPSQNCEVNIAGESWGKFIRNIAV